MTPKTKKTPLDKFSGVNFAIEPLLFAKLMWPSVVFYRQQKEIIESVVWNDETYVTAGHQLGKDFVGGFIALWFFLTHNPCRVVTTSVKDDHLRVLWGEIGRFIDTAKYPLTKEKGGPLIVRHHELKKVVDGLPCKISYLIGSVSEKGEGMAGHHAAHTLLMIDEASGVDDEVYKRGSSWAKRIFVIGNPYPCSNFFYKAVKEGDLLDKGE